MVPDYKQKKTKKATKVVLLKVQKIIRKRKGEAGTFAVDQFLL